MTSLILDPFFSAVVVPLAVLMMGAIATKVIKSEDWSWHHWILGVQMSLAAFSIAMVKVLELLGNFLSGIAWHPSSAGFGLIVLLNVPLILVAMSQHQDYLKKYPPVAGSDGRKLTFWAMVKVNLPGAVSLGVVIFQLSR